MTITVTRESSVAIVTIDNPPMSALSHSVRQGLIDAINQTEHDTDVTAVVLLCSGKTFIAGADIREFDQPPKEPHLPDVVIAIESASKPWIAAMHGHALGGGLEIALGCHYRLAHADIKMGFPEVNLGLIPGAGGTVRLPRLIAPELALTMISGGKPIDASQALENKLIDEICTTDLHDSAIAFANSIPGKPLPTPLLQREPLPPSDKDEWASLIRKINSRARGKKATVAATLAIENTYRLSAKDALAAERTSFQELKADPQSQALRYIFFAERSATRMPALKSVAAREITHVGIVGGGTMGAGIAAACLLAGYVVVMVERDDPSLEAGLSRTRQTLDNSLARGLVTTQQHNSMNTALTGSTHYDALSDSNLVVEAVFEDMAVKREVFKLLDEATAPHTVLASNTSYLDVNDIANSVTDPSRVIGLHFFSPAHIMKLLELVVTEFAAPDVLATGFAFAKRLEKIVVPAGVCDGFIGNRIMSAYRRECEYMLEDGALPQDIDKVMTAFGFPMGIFQMQDMAGLDIAWAMRKRQAATRHPDQRYVDIPDRLCELERFGQKTNKGWYSYSGREHNPDPEVETIILNESARKGIQRTSLTDEMIMDRIMQSMVNEGNAILQVGIAQSREAIDVVMVNGYGFPRWRGGPMFMQS